VAFCVISGVRKQVTEYGSIASKNSHLAGSSNVEDDQVVQEFCIKNANADDDVDEKEMYFMEGKTCLFFWCAKYIYTNTARGLALRRVQCKLTLTLTFNLLTSNKMDD